MAYQRNASDIVYDFICAKIRDGEWAAGSRIWTEKELSANLGVSKIAVRSAVGMLVAASVLRRKQGSGTFVEENAGGVIIMHNPTHTPNIQELLEILQFRMFFEVNNVELFIHNASSEDFAALQRVHDKLIACDPDSDIFYRLDFEFHKLLAEGTHNSYISRIYEIIHDTLQQNLQFLHKIIGPSSALEYHPLIIKYIQKKDTEIAPLLMRRHMEHAIREIMNLTNFDEDASMQCK